jgi:RND family efflux transporter MFP subunit
MSVRQRKWQVLLAVSLAAVGLGISLSPAAETKRTHRASKKTKRVIASTLEKIAFSKSLQLSGTTHARRRAVLSFSTAGRLLLRKVDVGDKVSRGQLLAVIDARAFRNQLTAAKATLRRLRAEILQAKRDATRAQRLVAAKAWPARQAEAAKTRVESLEARYETLTANRNEARRQLGESRLRAPFSGIVAAVRLELGEYATPGRAVIELLSREVEVSLDLPEAALFAVKEGQTLQVTLPFLRRRVEATVRTIGKAAVGSGQLFPLRATIAANDIPVGATAEVSLPARSVDAFAVPLRAIVDPAGQAPSIFVAAKGAVGKKRLRKVTVRQLGLAGKHVAIEPTEKGQLAVGDKVVVAGLIGLSEEDAVEVVAR